MTSAGHAFEHNIFINCPFDSDYQPILEAILFCVVDCGLSPRIATERADSGEVRLNKIVELIRTCRYSIHDLSRVQAKEGGEFARLNMPFELGIDYGFAKSSGGKLKSKKLLVIAEARYKYQVALSDIAGWDIQTHDGKYDEAIGVVRYWLASIDLANRSHSQILGDYLGYQEWDFERLREVGWNETDIRRRPTRELLDAMEGWVNAGRP